MASARIASTRSALVVVFLFTAPSARADKSPSPFTFAIPDGWLDVSPGAPAGNFDEVSDLVVAQSKNGMFAAIALDISHTRDDLTASMYASVGDGSLKINADTLAGMVRDYTTNAAEAGLQATVPESGLVWVGGVQSALVVGELTVPEGTLRQMQWHIPGGRQFAVITMGCEASRFKEYRPAFERAALATVGAQAAPYFKELGKMNGDELIAVFGPVVATLSGIGSWLWGRRRKKKKTDADAGPT